MKKRILSMMATLICLSLCGCGFAACGGDDGKESGSSSQEAEPTTKVTAEEWAASMENVENYTFVSTLGEDSVITKIDGAKRWIKEQYESVQYEFETIYSKEGDEYFLYDNVYGGWVKTTITEEEYSESDEIVQVIAMFRGDYEAFRYADGKYTAASLDKTEYMGALLENVEITFADGALVGITFFIADDGDTYGSEFKDFGTTTVTLPTEYVFGDVEPSTEVTAEEWAKILMGVDNVTMAYTVNGSTMTIKIDGTTRSQSKGDMEQIFVKEGDAYFSYSNFSGSWVKSSITEETYNYSQNMAQTVTMFRDDFDAFEYVDGKYVAETLDKTQTMNGVLHNVEIAFENGALVRIAFSATDSEERTYDYVIGDVGTTTITLPTDFTEDVA